MKKLLVLVLILFAGLGAVTVYQGGSSKKLEAPLALSTPAPEVSEVSSIEGTMKLTMTKKENAEGTLYSFKVSDQSGKSTPIFEKTVGVGETLALHHNSWSPNNKYVLIEDRIGTSTDYLIFKTNGESFVNGEKYLNATALFSEKVKNYTFKEITGWDDPVLVSVRTVNGPHFWFDITTSSFIQLAR